MNEFRVFLAVLVFSLSCYFVTDIIVYSFSWTLLFTAILGFVACHFIWPLKHKNDSRWYDWLELIIELPYNCIVTLFRWLVRAVRGDVDLDI